LGFRASDRIGPLFVTSLTSVLLKSSPYAIFAATSVDVEAFGHRLTTLLEVALVDEDPRAYQIPGSAEILSILTKSFDFALALATGGLRASAELKLRRANLLNPFIPIASSNDAISREEIMRIAARRAAEKHATQFARFTYVGDGVWDAKAARDLGWRFIGIGSGEQADRLRQAGAEIVIPDYRPAEAFLGLLVDKGGLRHCRSARPGKARQRKMVNQSKKSDGEPKQAVDRALLP
jgi:phosphoglycolate phosphatase-like HAD superfamily hydrolase